MILSTVARRCRPCVAFISTSSSSASPRSVRPPRRRLANLPAPRPSSAVIAEPEGSVSLAKLHQRSLNRQKVPWRFKLPEESPFDHLESGIMNLTPAEILADFSKPRGNSELIGIVIYLVHRTSNPQSAGEEEDSGTKDRLEILRNDPRFVHIVARAVLASPHLSWYHCFHLTFALHQAGFLATERPLDAMYHLLHHYVLQADYPFIVRLGVQLLRHREVVEEETEAMRVLRQQCEVMVARNLESFVGYVPQKTLSWILKYMTPVLTTDQIELVERHLREFERASQELKVRWSRN